MMSRFFGYADKVFGLGQALDTLGDGRQAPQIPTRTVWLSSLVMFLSRLGSLNALDKELRMPKRLEAMLGNRKPSGDTIGDVFCVMDLVPLRAYLRDVAYRLKRIKALPIDQPLRFAAVDGHEFFSQSKQALRAL
jgi:hypothetical protein